MVGLGPQEVQRDPFLRATVQKMFEGQWYKGHVASVDIDAHTRERAYLVVYEDGDSEHMTSSEVQQWQVRSQPVLGGLPTAPVTPAPQRPPPRGVSPCRGPTNFGACAPMPRLRAEPQHFSMPAPTNPPTEPRAPELPAVGRWAPASLAAALLVWALFGTVPEASADLGSWDRGALEGLGLPDLDMPSSFGATELSETLRVTTQIEGAAIFPERQTEGDLGWKVGLEANDAGTSVLEASDAGTSVPYSIDYSDETAADDALSAEMLLERLPTLLGCLMVLLGFRLFRCSSHREQPAPASSTQPDVSQPLAAPQASPEALRVSPAAPTLKVGGFYVATLGREDRVVQLLAVGAEALVAPYRTARCLHTGKVSFKEPGEPRREPVAALREGPFALTSSGQAPCRVSSLFEYAPVQHGALLERRDNIIDLSETPKAGDKRELPESSYRHGRSLKRLRDMGFGDTPALREVIDQNHGHVGGALRQLGVA